MLDGLFVRMLFWLFVRLFVRVLLWLFVGLFVWLFVWLSVTNGSNTSSEPRVLREAANFLAAFLISASTFAYFEEAEWLSLPLGILALSLVVVHLRQNALVASGATALASAALVKLGSPVAPLFLLVALCAHSSVRSALIVSLALVAGHHLYDALVVALTVGPIPYLASLAIVPLAMCPLALLFISHRAWRALLAVIGLCLLAVLAVALAIQGMWLDAGVIDTHIWRALLALAPIISVFWYPTLLLHTNVPEARRIVLATSTVAACPFLLLPFLLQSTPISRIVFDESHGQWATTLQSYGPTDFGRDHSYTYRLLADYSSQLVGATYAYQGGPLQLRHDDLFVLKMPVQPLESDFRHALASWLRGGGRLLVFLDHTDLYDSAQITNPFLLELADLRVTPNAVFSADGRPNAVGPTLGKPLLGNAIGVSHEFRFQTGTTFGSLPFSYMSVATHGPTYSEPGEYFRPNRFGYFRPDEHTAFANHPAAVVVPVGHGLVLVVTDSTPWSTFAMFQGAYRDAFRSIVSVMSQVDAVRLYVYALPAAGLIGLLLTLFQAPLLSVLGAIALGVSLASGAVASHEAWRDAKPGRDFSVRTVVGSEAYTEALLQLVPIGHNSYARILSGLQKYKIMPRVTSPPSVRHPLDPIVPVLLLEPDAEQLPDPEDVISYVRAGGRLVVLFSERQVLSAPHQEWLSKLRLRVFPSKSLALSEAPEPKLEDRGAPILRNTMSYRLVANGESLLWETGHDPLSYSFAARPIDTDLSLPLGSLTISLHADQFSDSAIGDIWEGKQPSRLARDREERLATLLGYAAQPVHAGDDGYPATVTLPHYVLLRDGVTLFEGTLARNMRIPSRGYVELGRDPDTYAAWLQVKALEFVSSECRAAQAECLRSFVAPDMVEWQVFVRHDNAKLDALELVHDKRHGGLGASYQFLYTVH